MISVKKYQKTVHVEEIIPSVIEPSFGEFTIRPIFLKNEFLICNTCNNILLKEKAC